MSDQEAVDIVSEALKSGDAAAASRGGVFSADIVTAAAASARDAAIQRGTPDNITVVVACLSWG